MITQGQFEKFARMKRTLFFNIVFQAYTLQAVDPVSIRGYFQSYIIGILIIEFFQTTKKSPQKRIIVS